MAKSTLIDSCVWIDYFDGGDSALIAKVNALIDSNAVIMTGTVLGELLIGARSDGDIDTLVSMLSGLRFADDDKAIVLAAARMGHRLKNKGIRVPLSDLLIAAQCIGDSATLMTKDKHFELIEQGLGLSLTGRSA